ncbi:hypothetical protein BV372_33970 [Nostoc sp. T09]|nr:hypothetical protein BV372_33970 [Nostoc sp. T09]
MVLQFAINYDSFSWFIPLLDLVFYQKIGGYDSLRSLMGKLKVSKLLSNFRRGIRTAKMLYMKLWQFAW